MAGAMTNATHHPVSALDEGRVQLQGGQRVEQCGPELSGEREDEKAKGQELKGTLRNRDRR